MFLDSVGSTVKGEPFTWSVNDTLLYAVSVGAGSVDPLRELSFTTENSVGHPHQVIPSFATFLTNRANCSALKLTGDYPLAAMIHASQEIELAGPIAASGKAIGEGIVTGIFDMGKHALVETAIQIKDFETGALIADTKTQVIVLGEGGFGGTKPQKPTPSPERAPDGEVATKTSLNQALIYRLNGDNNPLHTDPTLAAKIGFEKPILHGLCTFGLTTRELVNNLFAGDASRFESISAKFVAPVTPGATITTKWWIDNDTVLFNASSDAGIVLESGVLKGKLA